MTKPKKEAAVEPKKEAAVEPKKEAAVEPKKEAGVKVLTKRNIWIAGEKGAVKVNAGTVVSISKEEAKHFGSAVTRDLPESE